MRRGHRVHPNTQALPYAQDKISMHGKLTELGVAVPDWRSSERIRAVKFSSTRTPAVQSSKLSAAVTTVKDLVSCHARMKFADWFTALAEDGRGGSLTLLRISSTLPVKLAQLVARRESGETRAWPVVETIQKDGVCAAVLAPAPTGALNEAARIGHAITTGLDVTGVLAVEMFRTTDGRVPVHELAMHPQQLWPLLDRGSGTPARSSSTCAPSPTCRSVMQRCARTPLSW